MRILAEVTQERDELNEEGETVYEKSNWWVLYWGIEYKIIELEEGRIAAVNYSVAICQDYDTGIVRTFLPNQLKILGTQIKT
jgi:hypothetical protein